MKLYDVIIYYVVSLIVRSADCIQIDYTTFVSLQ